MVGLCGIVDVLVGIVRLLVLFWGLLFVLVCINLMFCRFSIVLMMLLIVFGICVVLVFV